MQLEIDTKNDKPLLIFRNKANDRYYFHVPLDSSDVAPGPVRISDLNDDEGDGKWFMFYIADCFSPPMYVVRHQSWEEAYEEFIDWQTDQLKIENADIPKDEEEQLQFLENCSYNSKGTPVDTEGVQGEEIFLVAALTLTDDRTLWNLACMFLNRVTRYDNEYDKDAVFRRQMAKCCTTGTDGHLAPKAIEAWKQARNLCHYMF